MPTKEDTKDPSYQNTYFNSGAMFIVIILFLNITINIIIQVFGFYSLSYAEYFSIIIFYLFLISCHVILPERMPGDEVPTSEPGFVVARMPPSVLEGKVISIAPSAPTDTSSSFSPPPSAPPSAPPLQKL